MQAVQVAVHVVGGQVGKDGVESLDGTLVLFHQVVEQGETLVDTVAPVNPFLLLDDFVLPCLVVFFFQVGKGALVAFPVEHLGQVGGVRNDGVDERLVAEPAFLLHLGKVSP